MRLSIGKDFTLYVTTRCRRVAELVSSIDRHVIGGRLFVSTMQTVPMDRDLPIVIGLFDGTPVLRGSVRALERWTTIENTYRRPGLELGVHTLEAIDAKVQQEMLGILGMCTMPSLAPPPPRNVDGVPEPLLDDAVTGRGTDDDTPSFVIPQIAPAPRVTARRLFTPTPRQSLTMNAVSPSPGDTEDLFSQPTRVATPLPGAVSRRYWLWAGASLLVLVAGFGVQDAADANEAPSPLPKTLPAGFVTNSPLVSPVTTTPSVTATLPSVGSGPCSLTLATTPAGATVALDGIVQGFAPLTVKPACGQHRLDITHPTHATYTVWGSLHDGQPEKLDVTLSRSIDAIWVTSRPPGATIRIDSQRVGRTPKRIEVLGHVPLNVEISKRGYKTVVESLYSTTPRSTLVVRLTPVAAPPVNRSAALFPPKTRPRVERRMHP